MDAVGTTLGCREIVRDTKIKNIIDYLLILEDRKKGAADWREGWSGLTDGE